MRRTVAAALLVVILIAGGGVSAQGTPPASPAASCVPYPFCETAGFVDRVWREYEHVGSAYYSPVVMQFGIAEYETAETAKAAIAPVLTNVVGHSNVDEDRSAVTLTSTRQLGDETLALSGLVSAKGSDGSVGSYFVAYLIVRTDRYLRFSYAWAWLGSPLEEIVAIEAEAIGLKPSHEPIERDAFGITSGGLWDAIPPISLIPEGYRFLGESDLG